MAAESSCSKTEEVSRETDFNRSAFMGWVKNTVAPYVSKTKSRGYKSASEVLEEYKTFKALHKTLMEGKDKLFIETFIDEYTYHYALYIKAEMLCVFAHLLVGDLQDQQREWINDQLWRIKYKYDELHKDSAGYLVMGWEIPLAQMGTDAQREIRKQIIERCMHFKKYQNDWNTRVDKVDIKIREFEELESEIEGRRNDMISLCIRSYNYSWTCNNVEDGFHELEKIFYRLLGDGEVDLAKKWSDVKLGVGGAGWEIGRGI